MYGSQFRLPFPDLANKKMFIGTGANPAISQMTFIQAPNAINQIREIEKRGGKVVFINPRFTESAKKTGEQIFIRPDTDIFFLMAFLNELIRIDGVKHDRVSKYMTGYDELKKVCEPWTPERAEEVSTIPADTIRSLVKAYSEADGAALYCATGINQGTNGTLAFWILEAINAVSGNLDKRGGIIVGNGLGDVAKILKKRGQFETPNRTRIGNLPSVCDRFPAGSLADEILTPGDRQLKALINIGGNPPITYPNPDGRLDKALQSLELLVNIDPFRNEMGNFSHYILPPTLFLERADLPMSLYWISGIQPERYVQYTEKMVTPPEDVREERWILTKLALAADIPIFGFKQMSSLFELFEKIEKMPLIGGKEIFTSERLIGMYLRTTSGVASIKKQIKEYPHGQPLEPNLPETFLGERLLTDDKMVNLAPDLFIQEAEKLEADFKHEIEIKDRYKLISKRERFTHNSWTHNLPYFAHSERTTNYLYISSQDAEKLDLKENDTAEISSSAGKVQIPVRISDDLMQGVVAFPHGWGHKDANGLSIASKNPGINANFITPDGPDGCEMLSGMSHMTGFVVDVRKV